MNLYGREKELTELGQWIVGDRCLLVAVLGMGDIGKLRTPPYFFALHHGIVQASKPFNANIDYIARCQAEGPIWYEGRSGGYTDFVYESPPIPARCQSTAPVRGRSG